MNLLLGGIMVFRRNKDGILEIQVKPRGKYRTLYHRMVKGKYQVYYKDTNDKDVILTLEEKVVLTNWVRQLKVEGEDGK